MKNLKLNLLFILFFGILTYQIFPQSFSFQYSGPTTVTVPFGSSSTGGTYYFQYSIQGTLIRPKLTIQLDGNAIAGAICEGGDAYTPSSYAITFTPGSHTVKFTISDLGGANNCTEAHIWQTEEFTVNCKYTINVQNNFSGGTINVDNSTRQAAYSRSTNNSDNIPLGAIEQSDGTNNRIWNASGINNSNWEIERVSTGTQAISGSQNTSYTSQSGDNNAVIKANLRKVCNVSFQNNFVSVGNGGSITVNSTSYSSPTSNFNVTESNPITASGPSQSINNITYYFSNWSTGSTNSTQTFNPTSNATITANYTGIAALSVGLYFSASNPNLPITLHWTEYPNSYVTQYQIWRKVRYNQGTTSNPELIATVSRGTTSYVDYEYSGTSSGYTDWQLWYDVRSYYSAEGTYPDPNWVSVFSNGLLAKGLGELAVTENKIENYPNPFNPSTVIRYQLVNSGPVSIKVYDIVGREIMTLVNEEKQQGRYQVKFDASNLSSGIYFYRIVATGFTESKKMILTK